MAIEVINPNNMFVKIKKERLVYDLKNHEKSRGPSVSGSKCPWGPNVALGDIWTPGTLGPRTFGPQDTWTSRVFMVFEVIILYVSAMSMHSSMFFLHF